MVKNCKIGVTSFMDGFLADGHYIYCDSETVPGTMKRDRYVKFLIQISPSDLVFSNLYVYFSATPIKP